MNKQRLQRVLDNMEAQGLDQILVTSTASVFYLTGYWIEPHERMLALYIDKNGRTALYGNEIFGVEATADLPVIPHADSADPVADLAAALAPGRLGVDKFWPSKFLIGVMEHRPDIRPVLGSGPIDAARRYKDEAERDALRRASKINDIVVETAIGALADGAVEAELAALVNRTYLQNGADVSDGPQLVCFGANAADPHHAPGHDTVKSGDCVVFDIFTPIRRYWCDMTRTVFYKSASEEQRTVYETVRRANEAAIAVVKPGVAFKEIDLAARKVIEDAGYGEYFTHRTGHSIGMKEHEQPPVSSECEVIAKPGMIFSIEPGIYLPGKFGVRVEDLVLVTEDGCEVLNKYPKDLIVVE